MSQTTSIVNWCLSEYELRAKLLMNSLDSEPSCTEYHCRSSKKFFDNSSPLFFCLILAVQDALCFELSYAAGPQFRIASGFEKTQQLTTNSFFFVWPVPGMPLVVPGIL